MILLDTGPAVALFDPKDRDHNECRDRLEQISVALVTTLPVLTEAFHILNPASRGAENLRNFVSRGGAAIHYGDDFATERAFELMHQYRDHPMDLADASLIVAAEALATRKIFTLDRSDFETYRIKRGHRHYPAEIL